MPLWGGKMVDDDELSLFDDIHNQFSAFNLIDDSTNCSNSNSNIAQVQKEQQESKMRMEMTKLLEMCLRAQDNKCDMKPSQSSDSLRKLASMLEKRLYKSAISFESYCDLQTLESRMRVVLYHLRSQKEKRKKKRQSLTSQKRALILKQKMGLQEFARAEWLVYEIRQRKASLAGQSCAQCQMDKSSCSVNTKTTKAKPFGEQLPTPVRDLFFRTPLLDIFGKYPVERIQQPSLSRLALQRFVQQAERHMEEYDAWKMVSDVI